LLRAIDGALAVHNKKAVSKEMVGVAHFINKIFSSSGYPNKKEADPTFETASQKNQLANT